MELQAALSPELQYYSEIIHYFESFMMISKLDVNFIIFHLINLMKYLLLVAFGPLFVKTASPKPVPLTLCPKENYHGLIMVARSTFFNPSLSSKKINFSDNSFFKLSSTTYKFYPNTNLKSF